MTYFSLIDGYPVCRAKPFVTSNVSHTILEISISLCEIYLQKVTQEIFQISGKMRREAHLKRQGIRQEITLLSHTCTVDFKT